MGSIIQMVAAGAGGTEQDIATIDIPQNGSILGCQWSCNCDLDADAEVFEAQISFGSSSAGQNDARQVISSIRMGGGILTAVGAVPQHWNYYCPVPDLPVFAGERIHMHLIATAGVTSNVRCLLHFSFDEPSLRARRT